MILMEPTNPIDIVVDYSTKDFIVCRDVTEILSIGDRLFIHSGDGLVTFKMARVRGLYRVSQIL